MDVVKMGRPLECFEAAWVYHHQMLFGSRVPGKDELFVFVHSQLARIFPALGPVQLIGPLNSDKIIRYGIIKQQF